MIPADPAALLQRAERVKAFIREHQSGGCKMLSQGDACQCPLCDVDTLVAALRSELTTNVALTNGQLVLQNQAEDREAGLLLKLEAAEARLLVIAQERAEGKR